jgi:hypothetical protein
MANRDQFLGGAEHVGHFAKQKGCVAHRGRKTRSLTETMVDLSCGN